MPATASRRRDVLLVQPARDRGDLESCLMQLSHPLDHTSRISRGRPSQIPSGRFTASASFVRWPISRRSNWVNVASTLAMSSPEGDVSTPRSSATRFQPRLRLRSMRAAKWSSERESRSSFETTRAAASPPSRACSAACSPGRPSRFVPEMPASTAELLNLQRPGQGPTPRGDANGVTRLKARQCPHGAISALGMENVDSVTARGAGTYT